jgi:hypothetical protein
MIPMRPLIEILEDERKLTQKLESIHRYMFRDDDPELLSILTAKKNSIDGNLAEVRAELREYLTILLAGGDES